MMRTGPYERFGSLFLRHQWCNQDYFFKTKIKILISRPRSRPRL